MKKFRYQMENLLQMKRKLEDQVKIAYGIARLRLNQEEQKLEQLKQKKSSFEDELRNLRSSRLDILRIRQYEQAIDVVKLNIKQQTTVVKNSVQRLEVARIRLNDAMVERKIQDRLKEKAFEVYVLEFDAEERKEVDELNSFQYNNPTLDEEDE